MPKQLVTREELAAWLTNELRKVEDCEECSVGGIVALREPDPTGCNWSDGVILSGGAPAEYVMPHLQRIVAQARERFNLR